MNKISPSDRSHIVYCTYVYVYVYVQDTMNKISSSDRSHIVYSTYIYGGTWWRSWLRHCATSRKVTGSIPNGVTGNFH